MGILTRERFLAAWIVLFAMGGLYLSVSCGSRR